MLENSRSIWSLGNIRINPRKMLKKWKNPMGRSSTNDKKKKRQGCQKEVWERGTLPLNVPQKWEKKCKKVM